MPPPRPAPRSRPGAGQDRRCHCGPGRVARHRPRPTPPRDPSGTGYNRLAPVLSMLVRTSKQMNKEVSTKMGISASCLSRILSGERVPTWSLTQNFARACGADPDVLRTVRESEKLNEKPSARTPLEGPPLPAALRLHQAIRTFHHRAGRPASQDIALASHWTLSVTDVASVIEGQAIPAWQTLRAVVTLLGGDRDYFEALWKEADGERRNGPTGPGSSGPAPTPSPEEPVTGISAVLEAFSSTLNEETTVESQRARLLDKRSRQLPSASTPRLAQLAARRQAGRNWTMRIARQGL